MTKLSVETTSAWWRAAVAGRSPPIRSDQWHAGYYLASSKTRGAKVPARIWRGEDGVFYCVVAGDEQPRPVDERFWFSVAMHAISETEFAKRRDALGAMAGPLLRGTLDLNAVPVPKWRK